MRLQSRKERSRTLYDQAGPLPPSGVAVTTPGLPSSPAAIALAAGDGHTCALLGDGTVWCWGDNSVGQLGNGTYVESPTAVQVAGIGVTTDAGSAPGAISLAAGSMHTCAVLADGTVSCWGSNSQGQIGDNTNTNRTTPTTAIGMASATSITAGAEHTCALDAYGFVWCWGTNTNGEINGNPGPAVLTPQYVGDFGIGVDFGHVPDRYALEITAGRSHTCALVWISPYQSRNIVDDIVHYPQTTAVWCWGANRQGQLGSGSVSPIPYTYQDVGLPDMREVAAGGDHTCALAAKGNVYCWGENTDGEIGDGNDGGPEPSPVAVNYIGQDGGIAPARSLSLGYFHSCAILADGTASCWGNDQRLQLGNGNADAGFTSASAPPSPGVALGVAKVSNAGHVSVGGSHTCGLTSAGTVKCWGLNSSGDLGTSDGGTDQTTPEQVPGLSHVIEVCSGSTLSCALVAEGDVYCFGDNSSGQLGQGSTSPASSSSPLMVTGFSDAVVQIACGSGHACAVLADGSAACWGDNTYGQVSDDVTLITTPEYVTELYGEGVSSIAAGGYHTCALLHGNINGYWVNCWGLNTSGQVGDGTTTSPIADPDQVSLANGLPARSLGLGLYHSCAVSADGTVECWGYDNDGELGNGTTSPAVSSPGAVSSITGSSLAVAVAGGSYHTCALMADGRTWCWGLNEAGQLGNDSTSTETSPVVTTTFSGGTSVSAGAGHTCATDATCSAWCWGTDVDGELGNGASGAGVVSTVPVQISASYYP